MTNLANLAMEAKLLSQKLEKALLEGDKTLFNPSIRKESRGEIRYSIASVDDGFLFQCVPNRSVVDLSQVVQGYGIGRDNQFLIYFETELSLAIHHYCDWSAVTMSDFLSADEIKIFEIKAVKLVTSEIYRVTHLRGDWTELTKIKVSE